LNNPEDEDSSEIDILRNCYFTLMRDKYRHRRCGELIVHHMIFDWILSGSSHKHGTLQVSVQNFHNILGPNLNRRLHIGAHGSGHRNSSHLKNLSPDEAYCEKMFEMLPRIYSEYSLKSVMPWHRIVLSLIVVELCQKILRLEIFKKDPMGESLL